MSRVVVLGDSLSMPRIDEGIHYEDTYPHLLHRYGHEVLNRSRRAGDTQIQTRMENMQNDIFWLEPDVVILHLGIVDCAPRLFYRLERKVFSQINRIIPVIKFLSKYRYKLTKIFPKRYVPLNKFRQNIRSILTALEENGTKVIVIGIADTSMRNKAMSYGFEESILSYNKVLQESASHSVVVSYIDMYAYGTEKLLNDGIHIDTSMHQELSKVLLTQLKKIEEHD